MSSATRWTRVLFGVALIVGIGLGPACDRGGSGSRLDRIAATGKVAIAPPSGRPLGEPVPTGGSQEPEVWAVVVGID